MNPTFYLLQFPKIRIIDRNHLSKKNKKNFKNYIHKLNNRGFILKI